MPPKGSRKSTHANPKPAFEPPANAIPQPLPPSVEEAYRRKCRQIKHRYNQIEESNDAKRLRLHRLRRQIDKMRIERAFLLEQISKRTSTNVEDSEGSPSPPPTSKPKDKPLRTKRGHRKTSMIPDLDLGKPGGTMLSQSMNMSPNSESFSQSHGPLGGGKTNGVSSSVLSGLKPPKKPGSAFDFYCKQMRPELVEKAREREEAGEDGEEAVDVDAELARGWQELADKEDGREEYQAQYDEGMKRWHKEKEEYAVLKAKEAKEAREEAEAEEEEAAAAAAAEDAEIDNDADLDADAKSDGDEAEGDDGDRDQDVENDAELDAEKTKVKSDAGQRATQEEDVEMGDSDS